MAIPMVYKSCLFDEALTEAVANYGDVQTKKAQQEQDIQAHEALQAQQKEIALSQGQEFEPEERTWAEIELDPFQTKEEQFVVCIDTMGQDRELTEDQKRFALETVERYIEIWEAEERLALSQDRDRRLAAMQADLDQEARTESVHAVEIANEIEEFVFKPNAEDTIYFEKVLEQPEQEEGQPTIEQPPVDDELREIENKYKMLKVMAQRFLQNPEWRDLVRNLLEYRVMRYPQIIQSLMFLTGSRREDICLPNTNKLCWKWIRMIKDEQLPTAMLEYKMFGETKARGPILAYQTVTYCEKIIAGIQTEDVESYHQGLGKLFKWLQTAIAGRKADIIRRKLATKRAIEDRLRRIEQEEDRKTRRADYLVEAKQSWETENQEAIEAYEKFVDRERRREAGEPVSEDEDEDEDDPKEREAPVKPVFDEAEALARFDERDENAVVEIPAEVVPQVDEDWPMTADEEKELINKILAERDSL